MRWANEKGRFSFHGHKVSAGGCLAGEPVGLRQVGESTWEAFYGPASLGILDDRHDEPRLKPKPAAPRESATANGPGDGSAFSCGQPQTAGLPTGKPPAPDTPYADFWREETA